MRSPLAIVLALAILAPVGSVRAFNGHGVSVGPVRLTIGEIEDVTAFDTPRDVTVTVRSTAGRPLSVRLRMGGLVDEWRAVGEADKRLVVAPGKTGEATFRIAAGKGACSALYPVHVYATFDHEGKPLTVHAVRIFKTEFPRTAEPPRVAVVPARGALELLSLRTHRVAWRYYDKPLVYLPAGWRGSSPTSAAYFAVQTVRRPATKRAAHMHPPWKPGGGTIFIEYRLRLPKTTPIELRFANAIRDHTASEPPSDGVTFRVWAGEDEPALAKLFERHTASKRWVPGRVDLGRFAGKTILLRLESHPGPKRNTTCDSSFWGEPVVVTGRPPEPLSEAQRERLRGRALKAAAAGRPGGKGELVLGSVAIAVGRFGLADAAIAFGSGKRSVVFDGIQMSVLGHRVGRGPSGVQIEKVDVTPDPEKGVTRITHHCRLAGEAFPLTAELFSSGRELRMRFACSKRITDLAIGPADRKARRVYYGHGYCIAGPKAFRAGFGGHNLATSHVGFDFEGGLSLLAATDHPPDYLEVDPATRTYALHTHMDATLTFVPGTKGAFDCAAYYRDLYDKKPAAGFRRKAGRFVFDIWGGRYAEIADTMKRMIAYGLTDSMLTVHVWQRWGYDYRLPDIHPPSPQFGTVEDMRKIAAVCKARDIPWGLHDNYIDFYPDAAGYSYDDICFTRGGRPIKAWINRGRKAQSYRWRPDRFTPFLKRNVKLIKKDLAPTHYFIDVFTSIGCFDYYDKRGRFHSMLETRRQWGEAFAWIRDHLGGDAPMTSEGGHDQLVGYLDGADCQFLQLSPVGKRFCIRAGCEDWERTPWFDAVLHDRFSLHGVGYSTRYQGGRPRLDHGIESDDYISAELLTGHALMIDRGAFGRGAVRKYWLAQDFIRSIATDRIAGVEFVGRDIHRQIVTWASGAKVYVNRGRTDWAVAGRTLPQYGYFAKNGPIESSIERIGETIVERSTARGRSYFNARGFNPSKALPIRPRIDRIEHIDGGRFRAIVNWDAAGPAPKDLAVFVHFTRAKSDDEEIVFQGDLRPRLGTSKWTGRVTTGRHRIIEVPHDHADRRYNIVVGLWDPAGGHRYPLLGTHVGHASYLLGQLHVERSGGKVTGVRLVRHEAPPAPPPRWNIKSAAVDFGPAVTGGAFQCRCEATKDAVIVTPLPDMGPFDITLRLAKLVGPGRRVRSVVAQDATGRDVRKLELTEKDRRITFRTRKGDFAYRIPLDAKQ